MNEKCESVVEVGDAGVAQIAPFFEDAGGVVLCELLVDLDGHLQACLCEVEGEVALQTVHLGEAQLGFADILAGHHRGCLQRD
jgi:hypothetical protein